MQRSHNGFTLVELIIAISLIGIFIAVPALSYSIYLKKGRDVKRKNDINQVSVALEQYKTSIGTYPPSTTSTYSTDLAPLVTAGYIPTLPVDPKDGKNAICTPATMYCYTYSSDGTTYTLSSRVEGTNNTYFQATPQGTTTVTTSYSTGIPPTSIPIPLNTAIPIIP